MREGTRTALSEFARFITAVQKKRAQKEPFFKACKLNYFPAGAGAGAGAGASAGFSPPGAGAADCSVAGAGAGAGAAAGAGAGAGASSFFWQPTASARERAITMLSIIDKIFFTFYTPPFVRETNVICLISHFVINIWRTVMAVCRPAARMFGTLF
jgi:hypothetical protein